MTWAYFSVSAALHRLEEYTSEIKKYLENENFVLVDYPKKDHTEVLFIKENYYDQIKYLKINYQKKI